MTFSTLRSDQQLYEIQARSGGNLRPRLWPKMEHRRATDDVRSTSAEGLADRHCKRASYTRLPLSAVYWMSVLKPAIDFSWKHAIIVPENCTAHRKNRARVLPLLAATT